MGRIWRAIRKAIAWLIDVIIRPFVDWVTKAIAWLTDQLRYWKHKFFELLAKWLENDVFFLGVIVATIALAIYWPKIVAWLTQTSLALMLKGLWEDVKKGVASILDLIHIIELDTINTMLKILWPEWRALMTQLSDVASALAEELGQGSAYIHAYFSVVHGLAIVSNSFIGADPELAEMQAFEDTSAALVRINDRFKRYNENPGELIRDLIEEVYLPYGENIRDAQGATIKEIRDNYNRVQEVNVAMHVLEDSLTHFIKIQPEAMAAIVSARLQPFVDSLTDALYVMDTEIMPKINGIIEAIELQSERQQILNDNILARISDPYELLAQAEFMTDEDRENLENYIAELEGRVMEPDLSSTAYGVDQIAEPVDAATHAILDFKIAISIGERPALSFEAYKVRPGVLSASWFQGEY